MKNLVVLSLCFSLLLTGCGGNAAAAAPEPAGTLGVTETALPTSTKTATVTPSPTITPTFTPSPVPTPTWVKQGPKSVVVPILLYHHIGVSPVNSQYYVSPDKFEAQMKLLHDWEYTTISTDLLIKAIKEGAELPPRPVIITFDDGDMDVYENAFPILQKYGFTAVFYLVSNYLGTEGYVTVDQIKEMTKAGWEIGSHSMNHIELPKNPKRHYAEIIESKRDLEAALGVKVNTFAYPFGLLNGAAVDYVHKAGYTAAMGLGYTADQGSGNLFNLQRKDIKGSYDLIIFSQALPWQGEPGFLAGDAGTSSATPTSHP